MRDALQLPFEPPCDLDLRLGPVDGGASCSARFAPNTHVRAAALAGAQDRAGSYHHDNFDIEIPHPSGGTCSMRTPSRWRPWRRSE